MNEIFDPSFVPSLQSIAMNVLIQHSYQELLIKTRNENNALRRLCSHLKRYVTLDLSQRKLHLSQSKSKKFIDKNHIINEPLSTLSRIQIALQDRTNSLTDSIKEWLDYHMSCLTFFRPDIQRKYFFRRFVEFEFHVDGSINYPRTARNILISNKFNKADKYAIACAYNFEEEIEQFWPAASRTVGVEGIPFDMNPLQFYWTCRMTDQMENIAPFENSRELRMIRQRYVNREWEMEYFWNRLSRLRKRNSIIAFFQIRDGHKMKFSAKYLCSEENDRIIKPIITAAGPDIMYNLVTSNFLCKFALPVWARVKNMFSEKQFINMYKKMFRTRYTRNDRDVTNNVFERLCIEIWNNAPDALKNHARNYFGQKRSLNRLKNLVDQ